MLKRGGRPFRRNQVDRVLVQISDWDGSRSCLPRRSGVVCLRNQGGSPDFRHGGSGSAKLADLERPLLDLFRQLDAADDHRGRSETLPSPHRAESLLHAAMVRFDGVVQVLTASHPNVLRQLAGLFQVGHRAVGCGIGIQRDLGRSPLVAHRFA